jgi:uridine phosphorylase
MDVRMTDWKTLFRPTVSRWVLGDLSPGEVPERVLLPCENPDYYDDGEIMNRLEHVVRRERFILGTFAGRQVAVAASPKFGSPSAAMVTDILTTAGAKVVVSVGYCGVLQPGIACGDLIIATGAVRDEGTTPHYVSLGFPAVADPAVVRALVQAAAGMGLTYHPGIVWTTDAVLAEDDTQVSYWHNAGVVGVDMETAAILTVASLRGVQAGTILVASDNPFLKRQTDLERLRPGYRRALDAALKGLSQLPECLQQEKCATR